MKNALLAIALLSLAACNSHEPAATTSSQTAAPAPGGAGDAARGKQLIAQYGCQTCHVVPGVEGLGGTMGPSLQGFGTHPQIVRKVPNDQTTLAAFLQNPQAVDPQTAMPNLGISAADARDLAAFLHTLK